MRNHSTSHSGLALVGLCVNEYCSLPAKAREAFPLSTVRNGIGLDDLLRSYVGLLTLGQSDYEALTNRRGDDYFRESLGIGRVASAETLRQRLDEVASELRPLADGCSVEFLRRAPIQITPLKTGHVPLDCDCFPMDNSKACPELDSGTHKEGVSRIYNGQDGYAPMAAYLGREGWCLELELREGKQHSQAEFIPFLNRVLKKAQSLTSRKLLVRLDSAHDAIETRVAPGSGPGQALAGQKKVSSILKWNPRKEDQKAWARRIFKQGKVSTPRPGKRVGLLTVRIKQVHEGKTYRFKRVMRAVERSIDRHGQVLLMPEIEVEGWWTTLNLPKEQVIGLYEDHGTSEQFHSEIKSDPESSSGQALDVERLPSGKFATNALILTPGSGPGQALAGLAYNILRAMGQMALVDGKSPLRHPAKRRRIKTVMQELIYLAARLVKTGRRYKLIFSRHCPGFGAFQALYQRLAFG